MAIPDITKRDGEYLTLWSPWRLGSLRVIQWNEGDLVEYHVYEGKGKLERTLRAKFSIFLVMFNFTSKAVCKKEKMQFAEVMQTSWATDQSWLKKSM